ncbi:hypothetical protein K402DRAFT_330120, partial [Aulographum hederae CBS 113979]
VTLLSGEVVLASSSSLGSPHWKCMETHGWIGFRNVVSGKCLGRNEHDMLRCTVSQHKDWEYFLTMPTEEGNHVLLMTKDGKIRPVGWKTGKNDKGKLAMVEPRAADVEVLHWQFVKLP